MYSWVEEYGRLVVVEKGATFDEIGTATRWLLPAESGGVMMENPWVVDTHSAPTRTKNASSLEIIVLAGIVRAMLKVEPKVTATAVEIFRWSSERELTIVIDASQLQSDDDDTWRKFEYMLELGIN
jgi:hypothetical protein